MSESTTVKIPLEITPPAQQPAAEKPTWASRKSLHAVKMPRREVQLEPQWEENRHGPGVEVRYREVEQQSAQSYPQQESNYMEQNQSDNQPQPQSPQLSQPPDPMSYDFYSPEDTARFHQDNAAYMQAQIDARVQAHLQPHMEDLTNAKWERDYNTAFARYGSDPNFKEVMQVALQRVLDSNGKESIQEAYIAADNQNNARPGQKGNAHLPEQLRDKKRGIGSLGRIIEHNHQTGRAKPFGGRNWRG